jgi:hypothetical protein
VDDGGRRRRPPCERRWSVVDFNVESLSFSCARAHRVWCLMVFRTLDRGARQWGGVLFALLFLWLIAPSVARAGCEHGGMRRLHIAADSSHFERLAQSGALSSTASEPSRPRSSSSGTPCSGALCSGKPAVPVMPVPSMSQRPESSAILDALNLALGAGSTSVVPAERSLLPIDRASAIFHPPRLALNS